MSIKIVVVDAGQPPLGVEFLALPGTNVSDRYDVQDLCNHVVQAVNHYVARDRTDRTDR